MCWFCWINVSRSIWSYDLKRYINVIIIIIIIIIIFFWPRYSIPREWKNYAVQYKKSTKIKLEWTLLLLLLHKIVMQ